MNAWWSTQQVPVSREQLAFYEKNGFVTLPDFFSPEEIGRLGDALDSAVANKRGRGPGVVGKVGLGENYDRVFNQMVNMWRDCPDIKEFSFHSRLAEAARILCKARHVRIYHDHAMIKPPGEASKETNWHQDGPYWSMEPQGALSAWIAVDDVTEANGCLHFVPESYKFGKLRSINLAEKDSVLDVARELGLDVREPVANEMKAGSVSFHDSFNFHYAGANTSDTDRRAFAVIYIPDYVVYTGLSDAAGAGKEMEIGKPWDHPHHPILAGEQ